MEKEIRKVFYFDIDGTITNETEGWDYEARTPRLDVIETIKKLWYEDAKIVLWTSRRWIDENITIQWLREHKVPYDELIMGKDHWDLYICDKSINIEQWMKHAKDNNR